jgi:general secretion pathway protein B
MSPNSSIDRKLTEADTFNTSNSISPIDSSPSSSLKVQQAKSIAAVLETSPLENDMPVASNELPTIEAPESYEKALKDIPEELKNRFADAVEATNKNTRIQQSTVSSSSSLLSISELPSTEQALVPNMLYQMHIYASEPSERWIKINGYTIYEGEPLTKNVILEEIRLNESVWLVNGKRVSLSALQDFSR